MSPARSRHSSQHRSAGRNPSCQQTSTGFEGQTRPSTAASGLCPLWHRRASQPGRLFHTSPCRGTMSICLEGLSVNPSGIQEEVGERCLPSFSANTLSTSHLPFDSMIISPVMASQIKAPPPSLPAEHAPTCHLPILIYSVKKSPCSTCERLIVTRLKPGHATPNSVSRTSSHDSCGRTRSILIKKLVSPHVRLPSKSLALTYSSNQVLGQYC